MTPKRKAGELFDKMAQTISGNCEHDSYCQKPECKWKGMILCVAAQNEAKQCALIAVDEIIKEIESIEIYYDLDKKNGTAPSQTIIPYWHQVKEEITKL
jgi:hypothetical protein